MNPYDMAVARSDPARPLFRGLGPRQLRRRANDVYRWIGRQVLEARTEAGLTQAQLARCTRITQGYLAKIEAGSAQPSVGVLVAIGACLGADLGVRYFPGLGPRLHDRFQAPMIEALLRESGPLWRGQPEVPVPAARGVIDLVIRRVSDQTVIACECHSELRRLELVVRRLAEKAEALRGRLGDSADVSSLLLLRSTAATRAVARAYDATLAAAFPARSTDVLAALRGDAAWPGSAIVWVRVEGGTAVVLERPPRGVRVGT
ncbi:MAG TPA: helix-turn-helix transcriptional regulator [Candidatus Binatia bacterium]|nr:helix-turn-helix transcriptional regulator [Candidatus Binatia bacterium]